MSLHLPIHVKRSADMPRPREEASYVLTRDGVFIVRNHEFYTSDVPAPSMPSSLAPHQPSCQVRYPRLGVAALEFIVGFFDLVYRRHGSESIVLLFWDLAQKRYRLWVPKQEATVWESYSGYRTALDVSYELPIPMPRNHLLVADIHCHCDFQAYTSYTDAQDERYRDGVHAVVGRIDRDLPEFHVEIAVDGTRFTMEFQQLFKGFNRRRRIIPSSWMNQVTVKVNRPKGWS